jgi:hypothetical protein
VSTKGPKRRRFVARRVRRRHPKTEVLKAARAVRGALRVLRVGATVVLRARPVLRERRAQPVLRERQALRSMRVQTAADPAP